MDTQPDLFAAAADPGLSPELVAGVRARLHAELARMKAAPLIPDDGLQLVRIENFFRYNKDALPPAEAAALWAEVNTELDRLYAALEAQGGGPDA